jgi:hypothetical protein
MTEKPVFTASELLTIHELASIVDRSRLGGVSEEDLDPILEKVKAWFRVVSKGGEIR